MGHGLGFGFLQERDIADAHSFIDRFAHVVDGEKRDGHTGQRFHFHPRLRSGASGADRLDGVVMSR